MQTRLIQIKDYLLLIDEDAEIQPNDLIERDGNVYKCTIANKIEVIVYKKDSYAGSFPPRECSKLIAYYPLTKEAKELDLPLLPNPFIEEIDENTYLKNIGHECFLQMKKLNPSGGIREFIRMAVEFGYKAAQSKQFSLDDMKKAFEVGTNYGIYLRGGSYDHRDNIDWEDYEKSLSTQQLPKEFIPEYEIVYSSKELADKGFIYEEVFKTITNSEGKQELVGIYKY